MTVDDTPSRSLLVAVSLASAIVLLAVVHRVPQGLYSDPGWVLRTVVQHAAGISPGPNWSVTPDPSDLSRDVLGWGTWWASGLTFLVDWLVRGGLSIGESVRLIYAVFLLLGAGGWPLWFRRFRIPTRALVALAALFPWTHYVSNLAFTFSYEVFVFGIVPWLLLAGLHLRRRLAGAPSGSDVALALAVGVALGGAYILKYAAVLTTLGIVVFVCIGALLPAVRSPRPRFRDIVARLRPRALAGAACVGLGFLAPILLTNAVNRSRAGTSNLVTAAHHLSFEPRAIAFAAGNPTLAWTDLDAMLRYTLLHPGHPLLGSDLALWPSAFLGALMLGWLLLLRRSRRAPGAARSSSWSDADVLAVTVYCVSALALLMIWTTSSAVSYEARHLAGAGMAVLPLALEVGFAAASAARRPTRLLLAAAGLTFVAIPLAYGVVSTVGKLRRTPSGFHAGAAGVANSLLAASDVAGCLAAIDQHRTGAEDVLYIPDPISGVDIGGRAIVRQVDFEPVASFREAHYRTSRPRHVLLLLPASLGDGEKGTLIRASFAGVGDWRRSEIPPCAVSLWETQMLPVDQTPLANQANSSTHQSSMNATQ